MSFAPLREGVWGMIVFLWAVITASLIVCRGVWWWSAGVVVKCRVDASIFFLDLNHAQPFSLVGVVCGFWFA